MTCRLVFLKWVRTVLIVPPVIVLGPTTERACLRVTDYLRSEMVNGSILVG